MNAQTQHAQRWIALAAILAGLSVIIGAFGTHSLQSILSAKALGWIDTGVQYQQMHSLALLGVGIFKLNDKERSAHRALTIAALSFVLGILLFCGSLYTMAATDIRMLGMVTPLGGLAFIVGWCALAYAAWSKK